jgi:hypothetical protein
MALAGALALSVHAVTGTVTNKSLRALVTALLGAQSYTSNRMSYDLRRLRLKGLIERIAGTNAYRITPAGQRFAVFYTKVHNRLLGPLMAADQPPAPPQVTYRPHHRPGQTPASSLTRPEENLPQTQRTQRPNGLDEKFLMALVVVGDQ